MAEGYTTADYTSNRGNMAQSLKRPYNGTLHQGGKPVLKVLIPHFLVGELIGKKGARCIELEAQYKCKLNFSKNQGVYPGTDQRIITISGNLFEIKQFHNYIIETLDADAYKTGDQNGVKQSVKIVCPGSCAGLIIGNKATDINALQDQTGTKILITRAEESEVPVERIVSIFGDLPQRIIAANRIADVIAGLPENIKMGNILDYSNQMGSGNMPPNKKFKDDGTVTKERNSVVNQLETSITIKMKIPETFVGALMVNQSQTLREVIDYSGAQIELTPKMESGLRILTIIGDNIQSRSAQFMVNQKLQRALDAMSQTF